MPPRITNVILDCADVKLLAPFWSGLLEREVEHDGPDFVFFKAAAGQPGFGLQPVPEPKTVKNRMHVDLTVDDMAGTVAWIGAHGGRTLSENVIGDFKWTTVADPEGNEFDVHE